MGCGGGCNNLLLLQRQAGLYHPCLSLLRLTSDCAAADMPHDDPDNPPFLYATHYSTPGAPAAIAVITFSFLCPLLTHQYILTASAFFAGYVMFWLLRAAPAHMLRLQSGRFDAPDRLFCSVAEAWEGVVSTNPTDVKELIPEVGAMDRAEGLRPHRWCGW